MGTFLPNYQSAPPVLHYDFPSHSELVDQGGTGTLATESSIYNTGSSSVRLTCANGSFKRVTRTFPVAVDMSHGSQVHLWAYVPALNLGGTTNGFKDVEVTLSSHATTWPPWATPDSFVMILDTTRDITGTGYWTCWVVNKNEFTSFGSPDWASIKHLTLTISTNNLGFDALVYYDSLYTAQHGRAKVILTFDDINATDYTFVYPTLESFGWKGSFALVKDFVGAANRMTLSQCREMFDNGHDFLNHSVTHTNYIALGQSATQAELAECRLYLMDQGLVRDTSSDHAICPGGGIDSGTKAALAELAFRTSSGNKVTKLTAVQAHTTGIDSVYGIRRFTAETGVSVADALALVDAGIKYGGAVIPLWHQLDGTFWTTTQFTQFCQGLKQREPMLDVMTWTAWYRGLTKRDWKTPRSYLSLSRN